MKSILKEANQLLRAGNNEEAMKLCESSIEEGVEDYMLYCLAALANSNLEYYEDGSALYEKAIKFDPSKPVAFQGLFKMYDHGQLTIDQRSLDVVERIISISESPEKRAHAQRRRREFLLELRNYAELKAHLWLVESMKNSKESMNDEEMKDIGTCTTFHRQIVKTVGEKKTKSESEKQLLSSVFDSLSSFFPGDEAMNFLYVRFLYETSPYSNWSTAVISYMKYHGNSSEWINARLEDILAIHYFLYGVIEEDHYDLYESNPKSCDSEIYSFITSIFEEDYTDASESIEGFNESQISSLPINFLSIRVLFIDENYERNLEIIESTLEYLQDSLVNDHLRGWKAKCLLQIGENECLVKSRNLFPLIDCFVLVECEIRILLNEDFLYLLDSCEELDVARARSMHFFHSGEFEKASEIAQQFALSSDWHDLLSLSEIRLALNTDPTSLLVKAAKINPRSSKAFHLLAATLLKKNPIKARSCAERAVKIRPHNANYVKLLDDLHIDAGSSGSTRLTYLQVLSERSKPLWLRKRLPKLLMSAGMRDQAVDELQQLLRIDSSDANAWADLAEAYAKRGNLQAAVNAYEQVVALNTECDHAIQMVQVLLRLGQIEKVFEKCDEWRKRECVKNISTSNKSPAEMAIDLLEAQARLQNVRKTIGNERIDELNRVFSLLDGVLVCKPRFSLPYKLAGDALLYCSKFHEEVFERIKIPLSWNITTISQACSHTVSLYTSALTLKKEMSSAWVDLGVSLTRLAQHDGNKLHAEKAIEFLRHAIRISDGCSSSKSTYWSKLAEAFRISGGSLEKQQHCLIRALQLNKANDEAWCRLGLLYSQYGKRMEANKALELSLKYNPELAEAWCCWAVSAHDDEMHHDAQDMFRQSLTYKATEIAVKKYVAYLCRAQAPFDPACSMVQFENVFALYDRSHRDPSFVFHLGVLSELFGHFDSAAMLLSSYSSPETILHTQRALLKNGEHVENLNPRLKKLAELMALSSEDLKATLQDTLPIYRQLFSMPSDEQIQEFYKEKRKEINIPLVVATFVRFRLEVSEACVAALHDIRPRHELIDVYPTIMPTGLDNELQYLEQDGEQPFRFRHHIAKPLFEELAIRRELFNKEIADKETTTINQPQDVA